MARKAMRDELVSKSCTLKVASRAIRQAFRAMRISSACVLFACDLASATFVLVLGRTTPNSVCAFAALLDFGDIVAPLGISEWSGTTIRLPILNGKCE